MRMQKRGTKARREILELLRLREENYPRNPAPTIREIATGVGLSTATVHRHVGILLASGKLTRVGTAQRNLRLPEPVEAS